MIALAYFIGFVFYCLSVMLSYSASMKTTKWYFPLGLLAAIAVNFIWLFLAKHSLDHKQIYLRGLIWDSMIVGCYVIIPILFYQVRLTGYTAIGAGLILTGIALTKFA